MKGWCSRLVGGCMKGWYGGWKTGSGSSEWSLSSIQVRYGELAPPQLLFAGVSCMITSSWKNSSCISRKPRTGLGMPQPQKSAPIQTNKHSKSCNLREHVRFSMAAIANITRLSADDTKSCAGCARLPSPHQHLQITETT